MLRYPADTPGIAPAGPANSDNRILSAWRPPAVTVVTTSAQCRALADDWICFLAIAATALSLLNWPIAAAAHVVDPNLWGTDGNVVTMARSGNTLYVGGAFTMAGPNSGGGAPVDRETGKAIAGYPRVTGTVSTVIPDGVGGWYVGGSFVAVGGVPRANLAHILASGRVTDWTPDPDGEVLALARDGQTLYVGGLFNHIGGQPRGFIAALDLATGAVTAWDPRADLQVRALLLYRDGLYVGGDFSSIGGQGRSRAAELDLSTGRATEWNPDVQVGWCSVHALAALGDTIYIGGEFSSLGAIPRQHLAAVSAKTGFPTAWDPGVTGPNNMYYGGPFVNALVVQGNTVYVGGHFTGIGGQVRGGLAQVDLA